ncbi:BTAD domain-containing putative transcriptional regulator [Glycomyces albidus]|uniref:AfsR family transcriptional regulator n=1 Tax=Glycomyces albidus TaxID=2656774 RepID=A0A6L5GA26_9ACTN|nr:BTAD domain-containing putative transcriptional regulator [Glycomyces albidus]MQM26440.1 AfsR family transcriptional regulator [Glycomyces albidus]
MRVELLGPVRVTGDDGTEIPVPAGRQRALLARLALEPGRHVTAAALIDALWPDAEPANAPGALHTQLSRLRRLLGDRVVHGPGGYRLTRVETDVEEFERTAARAESASREDSPAAVRDLAEAALALWRGPALAGLEPRGFADAAVVRLDGRREAVAALHIEARLRLDGADAVLADLAARHAADPLRERDAARYMRALAASGRRAEALAVYEKVRARLADELGVDPSPVLADAHLDVLRGIEPALPEAPANRLPQPLTACIGREDELAELPALLARHRLVTLTGPGGTGKTRLAVEAAHRLAAAGHAVRMVELAPVQDPGRLPEVVGDAIGSGESILARGSDDPATRLVESLRGRDLVLVVDNCEHLVGAAAELLSHLLGRAPGLRVLATSREALGIGGETVLGVGPLPLPERAEPLADLLDHAAIRLFAERGRQSDAAFTVDESNAATVLEVCTALDGLPLAIELAAARLGGMTLADLAARLGDRFGLLARGPRTAEPRQRTLRAVVDWSWDLLEPAERLVLARMSVFAGGADLDAACEVCSATADDITGLVDKSLVQRLPGGRYRLLETVRDYAAARLAEAGETAERYERHADYYARLAEEAEPHLMRAEQVEWLDRLAADHANLFAAIRRMVAAGNARIAYRALSPLSWYWWMRGYRDEGQELARQVRALPVDDATGIEPIHRVKVAMAGSWGLWAGRLDPVEIDAQFAEAQRIGERYGLLEAEPLTRMIPLIRSLVAGDEAALRAVTDGLDPERSPWVRGIALLFCSDYSQRAGRPEDAAAELAESHAIFERLGERFGLILTLQGLAADRMAAGDYQGARSLLVRALAAEAEFGADPTDSVIAEHLWRIDAEHGDDPAAMLERLRALAERAERFGNAENVIAARTSAAVCLRRLGRLAEARDALLASEDDLPQFLSFSENAVHLYRQLAVVARELGDPDLEARAAGMLAGSNWPFSS